MSTESLSIIHQTKKGGLLERMKPRKKIGRKFDKNKLRYSLLPWESIKVVVQVLEHGAVKYGDNNWKYVDNLESRYLDAAQRHLASIHLGEYKDKESGLPHWAHVVCCMMFFGWKMITKKMK